MVKRGTYHFDSKPFLVKAWNPNMDLYTEKIESLPIWVQLPDLELKYEGSTSLSKICSTLGIPLKTDRYTRDKSMIKYARVLVDMELEGSFPDTIEFFNEHEVLIRQEIKYAWMPTKCQCCGMFGHKEDQCRKKPGVRQEWKPVRKQQGEQYDKGDKSQDNFNAISREHSPLTEDGFTTVRRRATTINRIPDLSTPLCNSYQVLALESHDQVNRTE